MNLNQQDSIIKLLEEEFTCPISKMPIEKPVITPAGITYEKQNLEKWLDINGVEPQSKMPLEKNCLVQNLALKGLIEKIRKELPKLQLSIVQKDKMIQSLTKQVAQLRTVLNLQSEKAQQNAQLTESSVEQQDKIRKIYKKISWENEMKMAKMEQKIIEIPKLTEELKEKMEKQEQMTLEIEGLSEKINQLGNELRDNKCRQNRIIKTLRNREKDLKQLISQGQHEIIDKNQKIAGYQKLKIEAQKNQQIGIYHIRYIIEAVFTNREAIAQNSGKDKFAFNKVKEIIFLGVDNILKQREEQLCKSKSKQQEENNKGLQDFKGLKNHILVHRYLLDLHQAEGIQHFDQLKYQLLNPHDYYDFLDSDKNLPAYQINFLPPIQLPLRQYETKIDWSEVVHICCQFSQEKWDLLLCKISKFPRLKEIQVKSFTVNNLTSAQLSSISNLKKITIEGWTTIDQKQIKQIQAYKQAHSRVSVKCSDINGMYNYNGIIVVENN